MRWSIGRRHLGVIHRQRVLTLPVAAMRHCCRCDYLECRCGNALGILYQSTCVGLGYGQYWWSYFLEPAHRTPNPIRGYEPARSVTTTWFTNINVIPIVYAFLPRLRGRLTLR